MIATAMRTWDQENRDKRGRQLQLDICGELMDSVCLYDRWYGHIPSAGWVYDHWDQPDDGIWETRGGPKKFLYSQLKCWVAIERAIRLATRRGVAADLERWRKARDAIYRRIMDRGWSPTLKAFVQYEGTDVVDAPVLLMPLVKFISPTDPKWLSTLDALTASLVSNWLVYQYDPRASPDGVRGAKAPSRRARSGTARRSPAPGASTRRGSRSRRCSPTPTT